MRMSCPPRAAARANSWPPRRTWWTDAPRGRAPRGAAPRRRLARRRGRARRRSGCRRCSRAPGSPRAARRKCGSAPAASPSTAPPPRSAHASRRPIRCASMAAWCAPQSRVAGARVFLCHRSPGEPLRTPEGEPAEGAPLPRPGLLERLPRRAGRRFMSISPMPRVDGGLELVTSDGRARRAPAARRARADERVQRAGARGAHRRAARGHPERRARQRRTRGGAALRGRRRRGLRIATTRSPRAGPAASRCGSCSNARARSSAACSARTSGPLALERALGRGRFRELTQEELAALVAGADAAASG